MSTTSLPSPTPSAAAVRQPILACTLRVLVRAHLTDQGPACTMSAEVADRWLVDAVQAEAWADDCRADPEWRRYEGNPVRLRQDAEDVVRWAGGWLGAVRWLHKVMEEKVRCFRDHGMAVNHRVEHLVIITAGVLRRAERAV